MDLTSLVASLDSVVLEHVGDWIFERRSQATPWWNACVPDALAAQERLRIPDVFPFLEVFLPIAERVWLATSAPPASSELWTQTGIDGREIHLEAVAARVGDSAALVITRNDRTFAQHQLLLQRARELRLTYGALMREVQGKDILLHTIIHDLTAPLHSVVGALSLLREMALPPAALRWTDIATQAAARQRELIRDILNVFVAEQGARDSEPGQVDLAQALDRAVSEREPVARQRRVEIVIRLTARAQVLADETRLIRVLTNLLDNAIRYSPSGAVVRVTTDTADRWVQIVVEDSGPGVSPDTLPRLFQKLVRDPRSGGTGLGLYFCRITVEQWGGGIGYEPRPEGGAKFWVRLRTPVADPDQPARTLGHGETTLAR
jgi:signal transduction histidine kinase